MLEVNFDFEHYNIVAKGRVYPDEYEAAHCEIDSIEARAINEDDDVGEDVFKELDKEFAHRIMEEAYDQLFKEHER